MTWRYLAGGVSALLLLAAGFVIWRGPARASDPVPPLPAATRSVDGTPSAAAEPIPAATDRTREEKRFDRYDKDRNSSITREEYLASRRKAYARLDRNGDGKLDFEEWASRTTAKFAGADGDKSGALSRKEFETTKVVRRTRIQPACPPPKEDEDG